MCDFFVNVKFIIHKIIHARSLPKCYSKWSVFVREWCKKQMKLYFCILFSSKWIQYNIIREMGFKNERRKFSEIFAKMPFFKKWMPKFSQTFREIFAIQKKTAIFAFESKFFRIILNPVNRSNTFYIFRSNRFFGPLMMHILLEALKFT